MPDRDRYIPGVPCWIDTNQPDPDAAVEFYGGLFGWQFENVMPEMPCFRGFSAAADAHSASPSRVGVRHRGEHPRHSGAGHTIGL